MHYSYTFQQCWDNHTVRWDRFEHFHHNGGPFVRFETGELIFVPNRPSPHDRGMKQKYNLQITTTREFDHRLVNPETDEDVPQAWLNRREQQHLIVDWDLKRAYPIMSYPQAKKALADAPKYVRQIEPGMVWMAEGEEPITGSATILVQPIHKLTKDEKKHMDTLEKACKAWAGLREHESNEYFRYRNGKKNYNDYMGFSNFSAMGETDRLCLAHAGYDTGYDDVHLPYLNVI